MPSIVNASLSVGGGLDKKKGDQEDPNNYRGITLLNVVGKLFNKVLIYRLLYWFEEHNKLSESQKGFRSGHSCVDNLLVLNEVI